MLKVTCNQDLHRSYVPPKIIPIIKKLLQTSGPESTPIRGFVVFVEHDDDLSAINELICRDLNTSLEGVFYDGDCLVGVVIWGNSGDGVSIVCPNIDGYAEEVLSILRSHLPEEVQS